VLDLVLSQQRHEKAPTGKNPPEPPAPPVRTAPAAGHNIREVGRQVAVGETLTEAKLRNIQISGKSVRRVGDGVTGHPREPR
jgi:hypothetical protein